MNLITKASLGVVFMIWVRWTFPRLRIDQVITMCWKYCVPIAAFSFIGSVFVWQYLGLPFLNDVFPAKPGGRLAVREAWVLQEDPVAAASPIEAAEPAAGGDDVEHVDGVHPPNESAANDSGADVKVSSVTWPSEKAGGVVR